MAGPFQSLAQPFVTTGGGALPLPMPMSCAQPAMLRRASTAAVNRATFFIELTPPMNAPLSRTFNDPPTKLKFRKSP